MLSITFVHPDLGIGGAERLVVDAGVSLQSLGHSVSFCTSHYDPHRCFQDTLGLEIFVGGDSIPRHVLGGKFHVALALARLVVAMVGYRMRRKHVPDVIVLDQLALATPFAWLLFPNTPVLFYMHFPDKLLALGVNSQAKKAYRAVFDAAEDWTTAAADEIVVNSKFTGGVVEKHMPLVAKLHAPFTVLYPCVDLVAFDREFDRSAAFADTPELLRIVHEGKFILSLNRFERKKALGLAIRALARLPKSDVFDDVTLIVAGGYDVRVKENVDHLKELKSLAQVLGMQERVFFLPSCTELEKRTLLGQCRVLVYTPEHEHFGIVPIEAGAARKPVVACNSGGPLESIENDVTGLLVEPTPDAFSNAIARFFRPDDGLKTAEQFGADARTRIERLFSRDSFGVQLETLCVNLVAAKRLKSSSLPSASKRWVVWLAALGLFAIGIFVVSLGLWRIATGFLLIL